MTQLKEAKKGRVTEEMDPETCSMCSNFCALKITREYLNKTK